MIKFKSAHRIKADHFKEESLSYINEIYGTALRLSGDKIMAEKLTVRAYEEVCLMYFYRVRRNADLRVSLHRELLRAFIDFQTILSRRHKV